MSMKGQTHAKRAREFALKERRERKKAKKEAQRNGTWSPETANTGGEPGLETQPVPETEWIQ